MASFLPYYQTDYSAGLHDTSDPTQIDPIEASVLQNWDITYQGQLVRRLGLTLIGANLGSNPINGGGAFIRSNGIDMLINESTNLWYLNSGTFAKLANGFTSEKLWMENIEVLNKIYFSSENNTLQYWDRASTTLNTCITTVTNSLAGMAGVPHGNVMRWYKNHLFTLNNVNVGGTKYPNRIYWTNIGDPTAWDTTNNFFEIPGDGRAITAVPMGDNLVIFKERAIQYLSGWGNTSWQVTENASNVANLDERIGCVAPLGACAVGNEVWFVDSEANIRRIYNTDFNAMRRDIISTKIQGTLSKINKSQITQCVAWTNNQKVYFAFPNNSDTHNSILCVFDLIASKRLTNNLYFPEECWTTYTGWTPNIMFDYPTSTTPDLIIGDATTGNVYKVAGSDDNGVAINARWDGKRNYFDSPQVWKRYCEAYLRGVASSGSIPVDFYVSIDGGSFGKLGTLTLAASGSTLGPTGSFHLGPTGGAILGGPSQNEAQFKITSSALARGKSLTSSIRHATAGQQPTINTFTILYKNRVLR